MDENKFTSEEISQIDKKLGFIVFDWAKHLINHIISQALQKGVKKLYMNSSQTVYGGADDAQTKFLYEKLPQMMGFQKKNVTLRNGRKERMWFYDLSDAKEASSNLMLKIAGNIAITKIPRKYQGAFIKIIGKKPEYTSEEVQRVLDIVEKGKKQNTKKALPRYYYDWKSDEWSGGQRFREDRNEMVVRQGLPEETQNYILSDPTLTKFWALLLSRHSHFAIQDIGFALVSPVSSTTWVINEIQSDVIGSYLEERNKLYKKSLEEKTKKSWETIKDMLEAQNKSKWIAILETYPEAKAQIINDPSIIQRLPNNNTDIQKFIQDQKTLMEGGSPLDLDLIRHMASVNFNQRIFKIN